MKSGSSFIQTFDKLPTTLPVFPLARAVVLPGGELPLNIFEPRYLNMVQDAMSSHRLIGMIQPVDDQRVPQLYPVGCAGRITRYAETADSRLEIVLSGVCRFRIADEIRTTRGYRLVRPDWSRYAGDYESVPVPGHQVERFHCALKSYFERVGMNPDWKVLVALSAEQLASNLVAALPLSVADKQRLLEASDLPQRLALFTSLLGSGESSGVRH
jgi:uncharacterized protein